MNFDLPPGVDHQSNPNADMRSTSARTWQNVRDDLSGSRQVVYEMLCRMHIHQGPSTSSEVAKFAGPSVGKCPWKRMGELVQMAVVNEASPQK